MNKKIWHISHSSADYTKFLNWDIFWAILCHALTTRVVEWVPCNVDCRQPRRSCFRETGVPASVHVVSKGAELYMKNLLEYKKINTLLTSTLACFSCCQCVIKSDVILISFYLYSVTVFSDLYWNIIFELHLSVKFILLVSLVLP